MSFASLAQSEIEPLIERLAASRELTLLVGAGASMEAGLPSWRGLIERLLGTVAAELPRLGKRKRGEWVAETLRRDDLLGAGAVVEVMGKRSLDELVPQELYGGQGAAAFAPGPIAKQVAALREVWGDRLEILTTNYDDLLERALIEAGTAQTRIRSYAQSYRRDKRAAGTVAVTHLHGLAGRAGPPKGIVLTEEDYHRMQRGRSWQERLVTDRLQSSTCLFVGMSLADPNLIRYLYGYKAGDPPRHAAIFVRQGEPECPEPVRAAMEMAAAARWRHCGVQAIFVDHFADAAQLLYEIGHCRQVGTGAYRPVGARAGELIADFEAALAVTDQAEFARGQVVLSEGLRGLLGEFTTAALPTADQRRKESLGLALWVLSPDGRRLTAWAHSDRAHQDPSTIAPVSVEQASNWVSVRTVCQGTMVEFDRDDFASRWRFVRGLPLVLEDPTRIPIGALTLSSTVPSKSSALKVTRSLPEDDLAALNESLETAAVKLVTALIQADGPRRGGV